MNIKDANELLKNCLKYEGLKTGIFLVEKMVVVPNDGAERIKFVREIHLNQSHEYTGDDFTVVALIDRNGNPSHMDISTLEAHLLDAGLIL